MPTRSLHPRNWYILHLLLLLLAWIGPFLFSWWILIPVYGLVVVQFLIFDACLMNRAHALDESEDGTLYSELFEKWGWNIPRKPLKRFVRRYLYILLAAVTIILQCIIGLHPLIF